MSVYVRSVLAVLQVTFGGGRDAELLRQRWPYLAQADGLAHRPRGLGRLLRWAQAAPAWCGAVLRGTWVRAVGPVRRRGRPAGTGRVVRDRLARRRSGGAPGHGRSAAS